MILTYDAIDSAGKRTKDKVEAATTTEAVEQLRRRGLFVTQIALATQTAPSIRTLRGSDQPVRLPLGTLLLFTRQMAMLLRAGSAVVPAVLAIKKQMKKPTYAAILGGIVGDLEEGLTLTDALRKHPRSFDPVYCAVIAAAEASGSLGQMFDRLVEIVGKRRTMRNKILGALAYPALLIVMSFHIFIALLLFVLPRFNDMFKQLDVEAPASTRALLQAGDVVRQQWPILLGIALGMVILLVTILTSAGGRQWLSDGQLRVPVIGRLFARLIQGQVFRTMGMLLESRVGVLDSLDLVRKSTTNKRFQKMFDDLERRVTSGGQLSSAFEESKLVEPYICEAIHTGEESGSIGGAMTYCADILDETNGEFINLVTKMIEPMILMVMGAFVGGVAISLFLPLFDLTSAIR